MAQPSTAGRFGGGSAATRSSRGHPKDLTEATARMVHGVADGSLDRTSAWTEAGLMRCLSGAPWSCVRSVADPCNSRTGEARPQPKGPAPAHERRRTNAAAPCLCYLILVALRVLLRDPPENRETSRQHSLLSRGLPNKKRTVQAASSPDCWRTMQEDQSWEAATDQVVVCMPWIRKSK